MHTQLNFERLLNERLTDEEIAQGLLRLQPQHVSGEDLTQIVHAVMKDGDQEFLALSRYAEVAMDCCGTGGSGLSRFNTSSAVAFVLAAAGIKVAKFGNRAASGRSGSFDVLEKLGIPVEIDASAAAVLLERCNLTFLFAPQVYPALARLAPIRKQLGVRTVLNFIGPLLNPVQPSRRLVGVSDLAMQEMIAAYLSAHGGIQKAFVVRASCGLDDLCPGCGGQVLFVGKDAGAACMPPDWNRHPHAGGMPAAPTKKCPHELIHEATPANNAAAIEAVLSGEDNSSAAFQLVCLNGGLSMVAAGKAESFSDAQRLVRELLATGTVREHFRKVKEEYAKVSS
jgi:anthranilate phosphoribosyltransferase